MCQYCQNLINAIDRYIEKADNDLTDQLRAEGYVEPEETVEAIEELEEGIENALNAETDYMVNEAEKAGSLEEFADEWEAVKDGDIAGAAIATVTQEEFQKCMPNLITAYIQQTDRGLKLEQVSQKTTAWVSSWSQELGNIMKLDSHKEIEKILTDGLEQGEGIAYFTQKIMDSGIREPYWRARRVAVTEVLRAHSVSQQEAFDQSPSVTKKMWRHTGSYRNTPRPNHEAMDGQIVGTDEEFTLAGADGKIYHPMYPRDSSLPPGESVNCHCIIQPIVDEDVLGFTLEERMQMQADAVAEMDDDWEAELNAQNMLRRLIGS